MTKRQLYRKTKTKNRVQYCDVRAVLQFCNVFRLIWEEGPPRSEIGGWLGKTVQQVGCPAQLVCRPDVPRPPPPAAAASVPACAQQTLPGPCLSFLFMPITKIMTKTQKKTQTVLQHAHNKHCQAHVFISYPIPNLCLLQFVFHPICWA